MRKAAGLLFAIFAVALGIISPLKISKAADAGTTAPTVFIRTVDVTKGVAHSYVFYALWTPSAPNTPSDPNCVSDQTKCPSVSTKDYTLSWTVQGSSYGGNDNSIIKTVTGTPIGAGQVTVKVTDSTGNVVGTASNTADSTNPASTSTVDLNNGNDNNPLVVFIVDVLKAIVFAFVGFFNLVFIYILSPLIRALLSISPHEAGFTAVILAGWVFIRNVVNILFILALIIIGLATLFRVEKYNYKHLIPELVMMALLVNFSLVIGQLILGVADTAQAQFLPNNTVVINNLAHQLMVTPLQNASKDLFHGNFTDFAALLVYFIFAVGAFFAFAAIAAFLVIRIIALWLLLMVSPVAYAGMILPDTHHEATRWWSNFLKYAFQTPILGFFLHMCAVVAVSQSEYLSQVSGKIITTGAVPVMAQFTYNILSNMLLLVCLFAGLEVAKELGTFGADRITGWAEHATEAFAIKPMETLGHAGYTRLQRLKRNTTASWMTAGATEGGLKGHLKNFAGDVLNADKVATAYFEAQHHHDEAAEKVAAGAANEQQFYNETGEFNEGLKTALEQQEAAYFPLYNAKSPAEKAEILHRLMEKMKDPTANKHQVQEQINAVVANAYKNNQHRKLLEEYYKGTDKDGLKFDEDTQYEFMSDVLANEHDPQRIMDTINDIAKENKNPTAIGLHLVGAEGMRGIAEASEQKRKTIEDLRKANPDISEEEINQNPTVLAANAQLAKLTEKRTKRLQAQLENFGADELSKLSMKGMVRFSGVEFDKDGNAHPSTEPDPVFKNFISKMESKNADISQATLEFTFGDFVNKETGEILFDKPEQVNMWNYIAKEHPTLAARMYNKARGIAPGHRDYLDTVPEKLKHIDEKNIIYKKKVKVNGKDKVIMVDHKGLYDPKVTEGVNITIKGADGKEKVVKGDFSDPEVRAHYASIGSNTKELNQKLKEALDAKRGVSSGYGGGGDEEGDDRGATRTAKSDKKSETKSESSPGGLVDQFGKPVSSSSGKSEPSERKPLPYV